MELSLELIITAVFLLATNIISIRWLWSDLRKQEKVQQDYAATHQNTTEKTESNINNLFKRTSDIMKREQVEQVIKRELSPLRLEINEAVTNMQSIGANVANIDKSLAILTDRWERDNKTNV